MGWQMVANEPGHSRLFGGRSSATVELIWVKIGRCVADSSAELGVTRSGPAHASFREKALAELPAA